ncbi:ubiquitin-related modifier 1 [Arctopsyche grandis]|uniref:ubiquitin-related modifier 1 n=1 Tax=Arctopsyche grandis TaxID=121162 RepID=UPI00406D992C
MAGKDDKNLPITVKFTGGAELLFNNVKTQKVELPPMSVWKKDLIGCSWSIKHLLSWLCDNLLTQRPEMFIQEGSVRPGILVLVNETDWELVGQLDYNLQPNDSILFMSTLHGG